MAEFIEIEFPFHASQRERFQTGALVAEWAERYQSLFDFEDVQLARQQPNRHFFEWLAAVLLFESIGYLSLVEKYESASHSRKLAVFSEIVPKPVLDYVMANRAGLPDL